MESGLLFYSSQGTGTTKQTPGAFFAKFRWNFKIPGPYVGLSSVRNDGQEISYQSWDKMRKDNDYVKCKTTGRNTKLNPNTSLGTCMFEMRKTPLLHTDYDGIRLTANLLNLWPVKDCCHLRSAVTQVCQMLPNVSVERAAAIFKHSKASVNTDQLKRSYTPKSRNLQSNRRGNLISCPRDNFFFLLLRSNYSFKHWSFCYSLKSSAKT